MPLTIPKGGIKCPNQYCSYRGKSDRGLRQHFGHYPSCAIAFHKIRADLVGKFKSALPAAKKAVESKQATATNKATTVSKVTKTRNANPGNLKNDADYDSDFIDSVCYDSDHNGVMIPINKNGSPIPTESDVEDDVPYEEWDNNIEHEVPYDNWNNADIDVVQDEEATVDIVVLTTNQEIVIDGNGTFGLPHQPNNVAFDTTNNLYDCINPSRLYNNFCYLKDDVHELKLLQHLNKQNVPHGLYQDIITWGREAFRDGYKFCPRRLTRGAQVKHLQSWLQLDYVNPETVPCYLPTKDETLFDFVPVTRFDFNKMLMSLLLDPKIMGELTNLDVNPEDPFSKYVSPTGRLSTAHSGVWYKKTYDLCIKLANDFLVPIIFAIDEAKLQAGGNNQCCPVMFTTTLFSQKLRNTPLVWRPLGYIYDTNAMETTKEKQNQDMDLKHTRMHLIYAKVLETFVKSQNDESLNNISLNIGGFTKTVNIKIPCMFIIGDIQGGDKICCTSATYRDSVNRICRKCDVSGPNCGDPDYECNLIQMETIKAYVRNNEKQLLKALTQHNTWSAFFDVFFGACTGGVFTAAMAIEILHSIENGLMKDSLVQLFTYCLTVPQCAMLWSRQYYLSAGTQKKMPPLLWKSGISKITQTTAAAKVGMMFTVLVISLTREGKEFFNASFNHRDKLSNMQYVFQMMLCYRMWLKREQYWKPGDQAAKARAKEAIRKFLADLKKLWPCQKGQGWCIPKYHEQLHIPDDIERNGAPHNTFTGPTEHHHIAFIKNPARGTQNRQNKLDQQIAERYKESVIIDTACTALEHARQHLKQNPVFTPNEESVRCKAGTITIYKCVNDGEEEIEFKVVYDKPPMRKFDGSTNPRPKLPFDDDDVMYEQFALTMADIDDLDWKEVDASTKELTVPIYTEYKRHGDIFRCHPDYRSEGAWHDWVMIRWAEDHPANHQPNQNEDLFLTYNDNVCDGEWCYAPSWIVGKFFQVPMKDDTFEYYTIVWPCQYEYNISSVFTTEWKLHFKDWKKTIPAYEVVHCDTIVRHCLMIPEYLYNENESKVFQEIWPDELWGDLFFNDYD